MFGKLLNITINTALLPVSMAADVADVLAGDDHIPSRTEARFDKIEDTVEKLVE